MEAQVWSRLLAQLWPFRAERCGYLAACSGCVGEKALLTDRTDLDAGREEKDMGERFI